MKVSTRLRHILIAATAVTLFSILLFLYYKTELLKPIDRLESLTLLRQMKQLDAQWELNILKIRIDGDTGFDPRADPLNDLVEQAKRLDAIENANIRPDPRVWIENRNAFLRAIEEKISLVEQFRAHHSVLVDTLSSISEVEDRIQTSLSETPGNDKIRALEIVAHVYDTVLTVFEYSSIASDTRAAELEAGLLRLLEDRNHLPAGLRAQMRTLISLARTVLREQPAVNRLTDEITAVPIAERLDRLTGELNREQLLDDARDHRFHLYLAIFSGILAVLLLLMGAKLIHSFAVVRRVNLAMHAANEGLEQRVNERTLELREAQSTLVATARQAGMAEIATNVLHNVGNVLNSVNISADLVNRKVRASKTQGLAKAVQLMNQHPTDLGDFLNQDEKGKLLPVYLNQLVNALDVEQQGILDELGQLTKSVDHIKEIVSTQQSYAGVVGILEPLKIADLIEDALRMHLGALIRHQVTVIKEYGDLPLMLIDKHRMLLIIINLISNAKYAMTHLGEQSRKLTISADVVDHDTLRIRVKDDGDGIAPENITRIFAHGFTTRKEGHGFGLHSCALAAMEMNGTLTAHSDGPGKGAVFTLLVPFQIAPVVPERDAPLELADSLVH